MMKGFKTWIAVCLAAVAVMFVSLTNSGNAGDTTYKIGDKGSGGGWVFYDKGNSKGGWGEGIHTGWTSFEKILSPLES